MSCISSMPLSNNRAKGSQHQFSALLILNFFASRVVFWSGTSGKNAKRKPTPSPHVLMGESMIHNLAWLVRVRHVNRLQPGAKTCLLQLVAGASWSIG